MLPDFKPSEDRAAIMQAVHVWVRKYPGGMTFHEIWEGMNQHRGPADPATQLALWTCQLFGAKTTLDVWKKNHEGPAELGIEDDRPDPAAPKNYPDWDPRRNLSP
jgi:hypothetical protein